MQYETRTVLLFGKAVNFKVMPHDLSFYGLRCSQAQIPLVDNDAAFLFQTILNITRYQAYKKYHLLLSY